MRYGLALSPGALRLALAIAVMLTHYLPLAGLRMYLPLDGVPVYGFFFLSGFWITRLWENKYQNTNNPLVTFYVSRLWRIYPIASLTTLAMFFLVKGDPAVLPWNLLLLGENGSPQAGALLNPPAWSLAIELQFYLVAPFLIWALRYRVALVATLIVGFVFWLVYASGTGQIYLIHFIFLFALGIAFAQRPMNGRAVALSPYSLVALALCGIAAADATIGALITEHGLLRFAAIATGLLGLPYVAASLTRSRTRVIAYLAIWPIPSISCIGP